MQPIKKDSVMVRCGQANLEGVLELPGKPIGVILFAHGSGSSRLSPRNRYVAGQLCRAGLATLLIDLLTQQEDSQPQARFDTALLANRLGAVIAWLRQHPSTRDLPIGLFGASTGAAAALQAAAKDDADIAAVVSRGGRPDLAGQQALKQVRAPTLLIVGGHDNEVIGLNRAAYSVLRCEKRLDIVPRASHLFEEPGALEAVAELAAQWFGRHMARS